MCTNTASSKATLQRTRASIFYEIIQSLCCSIFGELGVQQGSAFGDLNILITTDLGRKVTVLKLGASKDFSLRNLDENLSFLL